MYIEAVIAAVAIVSTHLLLKPLSDFLDRRPHKYVEIKNVGIKLVVEVNASEETDTRTQVIDILQRIDNLVVNRIETTQPSKNDVAVITIDILTDYISEASKRILTELSGLKNVRKLSTEVLSQRFEK